ncbi:hypothetical protein ABZ307_34960 [Streptomyces griseorubiginosus]
MGGEWIMGHLTNLQLFLGFVTDPRYGWAGTDSCRLAHTKAQAEQAVVG